MVQPIEKVGSAQANDILVGEMGEIGGSSLSKYKVGTVIAVSCILHRPAPLPLGTK